MQSLTRITSLGIFTLICGIPHPIPRDIVIRHDRDDERYLALGSKFDAVGAIGRGGDGTLIAPDWVVTAAHVAVGMSRRTDEMTVRFGSVEYPVVEMFAHPDWTQMGSHDIALLRLSRPVDGIEPIPLYRGNEEANAIATLVGHGDTRTGHGGEWINDGRRRGATNQVDSADDEWLYFTFDEPPKGTDLEGTSGRGDSGGPALIVVDDVIHLAGVSSKGRDGRFGPASYGAVDYYTRVSSYTDWISSAMGPNPGAARD